MGFARHGFRRAEHLGVFEEDVKAWRRKLPQTR